MIIQSQTSWWGNQEGIHFKGAANGLCVRANNGAPFFFPVSFTPSPAEVAMQK